MLSYYLYIGLVVLLVYAAAAVLPSWRWMLGAVALGSALLFLGIWLLPEKPVTSLPEGEGRVYGLMLSAGLIIVYFSALAAKLITLIFKWKRIPSLVLHVALFALLLSAPDLWHRISWAYKTWPPSAACRSATFNVRVGTLSVLMPSSPLFAVWPGPTINDSAFSLTVPVDHRTFCAAYDNGRLPAQAIRLSVHYLSFPWPIEYCASPPDWARLICAGAATSRNPGVRPFPYEARLLSREGGLVGERLSTEEESRDVQSDSRKFFVTSDGTTPDGGALVFACSFTSFQKESAHCHAGYLWRAGVYIGYDFVSPRAEVERNGLHYDKAVRQFFEAMIKS